MSCLKILLFFVHLHQGQLTAVRDSRCIPFLREAMNPLASACVYLVDASLGKFSTELPSHVAPLFARRVSGTHRAHTHVQSRSPWSAVAELIRCTSVHGRARARMPGFVSMHLC